jgi:hypothetical protein
MSPASRSTLDEQSSRAKANGPARQRRVEVSNSIHEFILTVEKLNYLGVSESDSFRCQPRSQRRYTKWNEFLN